MQTRYRVHSCVTVAVPMTATLPGGQEVQVDVAGLCVELVEIDGDDTLTRRFVPENIVAAQAMFDVGAVIVSTLTAE